MQELLTKAAVTTNMLQKDNTEHFLGENGDNTEHSLGDNGDSPSLGPSVWKDDRITRY